VHAVEGDQVRIDLNSNMQGLVPLTDFESPPAAGESFEFSLEHVQEGVWILSRQAARMLEIFQGLKVGEQVEAKVIGYNSGGLELKIGPVPAFLPASQLALEPVKDLTAFAGQTLICQIIEINKGKKRVLLSRRALLQQEAAAKRKAAVAQLKEGQVIKGKVVKLEGFGAFVEISDGLTGLLHVSNIAHERVDHPNKVLELGQEVEVKILEIKEGGKRLGLGMKQLQAHPWDGVQQRYYEEARAKGSVTRTTDFGAFVQLEAGIEGLLHISQLGSERVKKVEDAVKVGDEVIVRVLSVDSQRRRLSLSRLDDLGEVITTLEVDESEGPAKEPAVKIFTKDNLPQTATNLGDVLRKALEKKG
jgi:ribosomal protein S1